MTVSFDEVMRQQGDQALALEELSRALSAIERQLGLQTRAELEARVAPGVPSRLSTGAAPVQQVGASVPAYSLGNALVLPGQANLLNDPMFEGVSLAAITLTTSLQTIGYTPGSGLVPSWAGIKSSSASSAVCTVLQAVLRTTQTTNPFNTARLDLSLVPAGAGTHEIRIDSDTAPLSSQLGLPFLVGAIRVARLQTNTLTGITSRTLVVELYDATDAVVRASTTFDLAALSDTVVDSQRVSAALDLTLITGAQAAHPYQVRLRLIVVASAAGGTVRYSFGESQVHLAYSPDAGLYSPLVSSWVPTLIDIPMADTAAVVLAQSRLFGDTVVRFQITADGALAWGPGGAAARDARLQRSAVSVLRFDNAASGRASLEGAAGTVPATPGAGFGRLYFSSATKTWHQVDDAGVDTDLAGAGGPAVSQVSRDAAAGSGDYVAQIRLTTDTTFRAFLGLTTANAGSLEFGGGGVGARDVRLRRTAAGESTLDTIGGALTTALVIEATAAQSSALRLQVAGDTVPRLELRGDGTVSGLLWSTGAATAASRLRRTGVGQITLDGNGQANATNLVIEATAGQASQLYLQVAADAAPRIVIRGDSGLIGIILGSGAVQDLRAYRSAAKILTVDDAAAGAVTLNVIGTLQQGGVGVELVTGATAGPDANITVDAAGAAGTASTHARSQHGHQVVTTAGPGAVATVDAAGAAGATGAVARAGHGHEVDTSATLPVALGAAAAGTTGAIARSTHVHPTTGLSLNPHGAADHTDVTRKVFLSAALAKLDVATAVNLGASPNLTGATAYADAATQGSFYTFQVPDDWASGVITLQPVWSPGATDAVAHTVRWSMTCQTVAAGVTVTAAGTTVAFTGASAARTVGVVVYDTATSTTLTPAAAGDLFRFELQRIGADAADTYVGVVNLLGVIVSYTANQ